MLTSPSNSESRSFGSANPAAVQRKKRNLPGNPDPDAEVIALSPKSLLATNRFLCEICNKGFQRDQNLQLHRRGHNLPWKLKQRTTKEARKRVYICPEPSCVHHDPSRALGDLTGIKKHFSRKHGEKKWKCDKCSKKYAVQSDWKAHAKICGMREYRCDCGTIFSRRDSFITHRAFCDSLAEESARVATATPMKTLLQVKPATSSSTALCPTSSNLPTRASPTPLQSQSPFELQSSMDFKREDSFSMSSVVGMPLWLKAPTTTMNQMERFMPSFEFANSIHPTQEPIVRSDFSSTSSAPMSATALLQKAAEMGATVSKPSSTATASNSHGLELGSLKDQGSHVDHHEAQSLQDIMSSLPGPAFGSFEEAFSGFLSSRSDGKDRREDELTRDFLGVGGLSGFRDLAHRDLLSMSCIDHSVSNPCFDESSGNGNDLRSENSFNADQFINPKPW